MHFALPQAAIVPIVRIQNRYSVADRGSEDVLEYCEKEKMVLFRGSHSQPVESPERTAPSVTCCATRGDTLTGGSGVAARAISSYIAIGTLVDENRYRRIRTGVRHMLDHLPHDQGIANNETHNTWHSRGSLMHDFAVVKACGLP
jgi:hypothetical protein